MQRSSASIGSLAGALAKAQAELVNPEKSLAATIRTDATGAEQTFRYAPLSSGLEIVRKTLGQHEIATMQTTSIDQAAGVVNLTTVLAHVSGEWIASDWPVCAISETATPHRMGAALTYARRYALFTLVGIAGEDDLDAPDLNAPTSSDTSLKNPTASKKGPLNGGQSQFAPPMPHSRGAKAVSKPAKPILGIQASAVMRDQLVAELKAVASSDEAATWAHRILGAKNSLSAADARQVEDAFQATLATLESAAVIGDVPLSPVISALLPPSSLERRPLEPVGTSIAEGIDKSRLNYPEPRRIRDRDHIKFVAKQPCLICGRLPSDAHHLRFAQHRALGRKVSDEFTVPLCRGHHREVHRCGDEAGWWEDTGIDPSLAARTLWLETHPLPTNPDKTKIEDMAAVAFIDADQSSAKRPRQVGKRGQNYKTKPITSIPQT